MPDSVFTLVGELYYWQEVDESFVLFFEEREVGQSTASATREGCCEENQILTVEFGYGMSLGFESKGVFLAGRCVALPLARRSQADLGGGRGKAIGIKLASREAILSEGCNRNSVRKKSNRYRR